MLFIGKEKFMNQKKIGEFIAECRKAKKLTQSELAESLGVTEKSISNWENGRNMPDLSLFKPLCAEFDITINELMNGEKLTKENNQANLDENIIKLTELAQLKSIRNGIMGMLILFVILLIISLSKNESPANLINMLCAYNSVTYLSRYKINKSKTDLLAGISFLIAVIFNTISFILT